MNRIVVSRLRFLGDIVMSTPLLQALRESFPRASIEYVCAASFAPLLEHHPGVDRVHALAVGAGPLESLRRVRDLRRPRVDWWIELFGNPRSAVLAALARPRHSVGSRRGLRSRVFQHRREDAVGVHSVVMRHLDKLVPLLGHAVPPQLPTLFLGPGEGMTRRDRLGLTAEPAPVLLHPGSSWPDKAWPRERWVDLVTQLEAGGRGPLWMLRPPGEDATIAWLAGALGSRVRILPELSIRDCLAVLDATRLYIGNDGGILHCAVALRCPCIGLFGPTDPRMWFPYQDDGPFRVLHRFNEAGPCPRCGVDHVSRLAHLEVSDVMIEVEALEPRNRNAFR